VTGCARTQTAYRSEGSRRGGCRRPRRCSGALTCGPRCTRRQAVAHDAARQRRPQQTEDHAVRQSLQSHRLCPDPRSRLLVRRRIRRLRGHIVHGIASPSFQPGWPPGFVRVPRNDRLPGRSVTRHLATPPCTRQQVRRRSAARNTATRVRVPAVSPRPPAPRIVSSRRIFDAGIALGSRDQSPVHASGGHAHLCDGEGCIRRCRGRGTRSSPSEFGGTTGTAANLGDRDLHQAKGSPWHI
jgi:hypothetical protein